jgi:hypothetical protein
VGSEQALRELRRAQASNWQAGLFLAGVPIKVLQAEATMASQAASYLYQSELKESRMPGRGTAP